MKKIQLKISTNQIVFLLSGISILWIFAYKFIFIHQDPIFTKASETADVFYSLLSSVVASGIFYFFVIYLEQRRVSKIIDPIIQQRLKTFDVALFLIKKDLYGLKQMPVPNVIPELNEFEVVCEGIILTQKAPEIIGNPSHSPENWFEYFDYFFQSDKYISNLLYSQINYLTPEIIKLLDEIQYSQFQRALNVYQFNQRYDRLSGASGPLWLYLKNLEKLSNFSKSKLR